MSLQPDREPLTVYKGVTWEEDFTLYVDAAGTAPWNLTGYTAAFTVRSKPGGNVLLSLTVGSGITLGGVLGTIVVKQTAAQTAAYTWDTGASYTLSITAADGTVSLLLVGNIDLESL